MAAARVRRWTTAGVGALLILGPVAAAHADPSPPEPPAAGDSVVLIVHAAGDASDVRAAAAGAQSATVDVRHTFPADHAFSVAVPSGDRAAAVAALRATPGVTGVEAPVTRTFSADPNDPLYPAERSYLTSVDAPAAWAVTHGSATVRIAVVDSGIDATHPDLATKIVGRYNADNGGTDITDQLGHGTFVAGVAAAATNNGTGVAGAGYDTTLLGVKIADADGELSLDDEIAGINWAVAHGAGIINLSLGGTDYSAAERTAVENAIAKGVLVVAAAGNDANATLQYPAAYPGVIAVGAVDTATHRRASFSSYGSWVTLAAPGVDIEGTTPRAGSDYFTGRTGYAQADGTSFAAPLVAGAAALLKARDPAATVAQLRQALVASAAGYAGQGLGAGQVDFARALAHLPPTQPPTAVTAAGVADRITLTAFSASPTVEFRLDSGPWTVPVTTSAGVASTPFDTWGYANGDHTVYARACSRYGECGTATVQTPLTLANTAPTVASPNGSEQQSGPFTVTATHPSGGGARLLIDGTAVGFAATSPYSFTVNASRLRDGSHTLALTACSVSGVLCAGPTSAPVTITTRSLHPVITALVHPVISPNGDRSGDNAVLQFTLPDSETVTVRTLDSTRTVVRSETLGTLPTGRYSWSWRGIDARGARLRDGRYTLALVTQSPAGTDAALRGYADVAGSVDTVAPRLSALTGANSTFYPVHDGYRDTFAPGITASKAGTVTLTIRTGRGAVVRTLGAGRAAGRTALVWDGRDSRHRLVAAGRYRWQYSVTDAAGNRAVAANDVVTVSAKKLIAKVAYLRRYGASYRAAGGTDSCAYSRKRTSTYGHGVALRNACSPGTGDFAYASYRFTVPGAIRYSRVTFQVYGRSTHRPSELTVSVDRIDGGLEIPAYVTVSRARPSWYSIASVPAAGHITKARHAYASLLLTGRYRGANTFDVKYARLRVSYTALG